MTATQVAGTVSSVADRKQPVIPILFYVVEILTNIYFIFGLSRRPHFHLGFSTSIWAPDGLKIVGILLVI